MGWLLDDITVSKIRQRKTNTVYSFLYVESKKFRNRGRNLVSVARGGGNGEMFKRYKFLVIR